jgi:PAS domain S-box-containing protein
MTARKQRKGHRNTKRKQIKRNVGQVEEALRESEQQMRLFMEATADSVWNWDMATGNVVRSVGFNRAFGYSVQEVDSSLRWWEERLHPDDRERVLSTFESAVASGRIACSYEYRFRRKDGSYAVIHDRAYIVRNKSAKAVRALGAMTDITERRQAEETLRASEHRARMILQKVVHLSTDMISFTPERIDAGVNGALAEIGTFAGVDRSYVFLFDEARTHVTNTHEWCAPGIEREIQRLQNLPVGDYPWVIPKMLRGDVVHVPRMSELPADARAERKEWEIESIQSILLVPMQTSGVVTGYVGFDAVCAEKTWSSEFIALLRYFGEIVSNTLTRRQAAAALIENRLLASSAEQMRSLSRRLVEVRDQEQHRLSAELHDRIGQNLTALSINLNIIDGLIPLELQPKLAERLRDSKGLVENSISFARDMIAELRPPALDDYGLLAGLRWYGAQVQRRTGMATAVEGDEPVPRLAAPVEGALFRIAQEALANTVKHARARKASLRISHHGGGTILTIADDGVGFDLASLHQLHLQGHWGLIIMQERAEAVGAQLRKESAPGQGTRIVVEIAGPA